MAKQIKIDPDHKPLDNSPLCVQECPTSGGWGQFEQWAGVSWFGSKLPERYGKNPNIPSRFPIVERDSRNGTEPKPKPKSRYE
jgi:hypothetical protein